MAAAKPVIFGEHAKMPPDRQNSKYRQNVDRLSIISSHLHRRADIALIGLAVMVSRELFVVVAWWVNIKVLHIVFARYKSE